MKVSTSGENISNRILPQNEMFNFDRNTGNLLSMDKVIRSY